MAGEMTHLAETDIGRAIVEGDAPRLGKLLAAQNKPYVDRKGNTFLHLVATMYRPFVFNVLVERGGINVNAQNKHGNTALHVSALQDECCHVPDLMAVGVNPLIRNKDGKLAEDLGRNNRRWMDLYKKFYPGLRNAVADHDVKRVEYLLQAWCAVHIVVDGKDMRQFAAAKRFHDIVAMIDKHRFSLMAVYAIKCGDQKSLAYAISREYPNIDVNFLQLLSGSHPHHMLQLAIRRRDKRMVEALCTAGADVNTSVYVKEYFRGPLFFEAIKFGDEIDLDIFKTVIKHADLLRKDERGRSGLIYAIDRRNGDVTKEIIQYLLDNDADISQRDGTGVTARNVAMFARRPDIVKLIDKHLVKLIKSSDMDRLMHLVEMGYDDMFIEYEYRDSWVYSCGNDTNEVTRLLEGLPEFADSVVRVHSAVERGSIEDLLHEIHIYPANMLLVVKDKGGRSPLVKALLYGHTNVALWLMWEAPGLAVGDKDVFDRTPLHYAYASGNTRVVEILNTASNAAKADVFGVLPQDMREAYPDFIEQQQNESYGLTTEVHCVKLYEELLHIIRSKRRDYRDFTEKLKELRYPVSKLYNLFHPSGHPLVSHYRDLLLVAIDRGKLQEADKLVSLGADASHWESPSQIESGWLEMLEMAADQATLQGYQRLAKVIRTPVAASISEQ